MTRECRSLKNGENVVFYLYSDIYKKKIPKMGTVVNVNKNEDSVWVNYLEGYKDRNECVPFEDMIAVYNKDGEMMQFEKIKGPSDLLVPYLELEKEDVKNDEVIEQERE